MAKNSTNTSNNQSTRTTPRGSDVMGRLKNSGIDEDLAREVSEALSKFETIPNNLNEQMRNLLMTVKSLTDKIESLIKNSSNDDPMRNMDVEGIIKVYLDYSTIHELVVERYNKFLEAIRDKVVKSLSENGDLDSILANVVDQLKVDGITPHNNKTVLEMLEGTKNFNTDEEKLTQFLKSIYMGRASGTFDPSKIESSLKDMGIDYDMSLSTYKKYDPNWSKGRNWNGPISQGTIDRAQSMFQGSMVIEALGDVVINASGSSVSGGGEGGDSEDNGARIIVTLSEDSKKELAEAIVNQETKDESTKSKRNILNKFGQYLVGLFEQSKFGKLIKGSLIDLVTAGLIWLKMRFGNAGLFAGIGGILSTGLIAQLAPSIMSSIMKGGGWAPNWSWLPKGLKNTGPLSAGGAAGVTAGLTVSAIAGGVLLGIGASHIKDDIKGRDVGKIATSSTMILGGLVAIISPLLAAAGIIAGPIALAVAGGAAILAGIAFFIRKWFNMDEDSKDKEHALDKALGVPPAGSSDNSDSTPNGTPNGTPKGSPNGFTPTWGWGDGALSHKVTNNGKFGVRTLKSGKKENHVAVDLDFKAHEAVYSDIAGEVVYAGAMNGFGEGIIIQSGRYAFLYGHIHPTKKSGKVKIGEQIGTVLPGKEPHVHLEAQDMGSKKLTYGRSGYGSYFTTRNTKINGKEVASFKHMVNPFEAASNTRVALQKSGGGVQQGAFDQILDLIKAVKAQERTGSELNDKYKDTKVLDPTSGSYMGIGDYYARHKTAIDLVLSGKG